MGEHLTLTQQWGNTNHRSGSQNHQGPFRFWGVVCCCCPVSLDVWLTSCFLHHGGGLLWKLCCILDSCCRSSSGHCCHGHGVTIRCCLLWFSQRTPHNVALVVSHTFQLWPIQLVPHPKTGLLQSSISHSLWDVFTYWALFFVPERTLFMPTVACSISSILPDLKKNVRSRGCGQVKQG